LPSAAASLVKEARAGGLHFATAESCTAGLTASLIAEIPGASDVLWGGFITYTLEAKSEVLAVDPSLLSRYGAVSSETACAMALGALKRARVDLAVSLTGLAGPDGDGSPNPVGTVWIGLATKASVKAKVYHFDGSRNEIRQQAAEEAINCLLSACRYLTDN
jgi:PncC family amidohydrolase